MDPRARSSTVDPRTSLALWLRAGRAQRNLTLDDVARVTKIQARILEKLETGQLEGLPAEVFVRGFVKSFARCVGLDEGEAGERYGACAAVASSPAIPAARAFVETLVAAPPRERAQKQLAAAPVVEPIVEIAPAVEIAPVELAPPVIEAAPVVIAPPVIEAAPIEAAPIEKKKRTRKKATSTAPASTAPRTRKKKQTAAAAPADGAKLIEPPNDIVRDARPDLESATAEIEAKANIDREPSASSTELAAASRELVASSSDLAAASSDLAAASGELAASSGELAASSTELAISNADLAASSDNLAASSSTLAAANGVAASSTELAAANGVAASSTELASSSDELASSNLFAMSSASDATTAHAIEVIDQSAPLPIDELALAEGSEPVINFDEPTQIWQPTMPPPTTTVPWKRPTARVSAFSAPILVIDDADPEQADQERDEREAAAKAPHRVSFLPPILLDRDDKSARQGGLTLAVIILLIAATLTLSYLMRHPSASGDGVTMLDTHTFVA